MIDLDGIDLLGYEKGESGWHIDPESGFKIGAGINDVQWVERKFGAVPLADPRKPNMELEIPLIYVAEDDDEILSAVGELAEKSTAIAASAPTGGTEITWQKLGAAYPSTLDCLWLEIGEVAITVEDQRMRVGRLTIKITCAPYIFGTWYTAASGFKPTGMIAVDAEIADAKGDLPGQAKLELTNAGTVAQQFVNAGIQWRHADADDTATLLPSTFDYSTAPLNGSYTAATNEVQRATPSGTISGGTFTLTFDGYTTSALAHNASTATVQAALEALSSVEVGDIVVSGSALSAGNMDFTFGGRLAGTNVAAISITSSLTGGGTVAMSTTTAGVAGYVANTSLQSEWSSFVRTAGQTDVGDYELWALVQTSASANDCLVRATVSVGDASSGTTNLLAAVPASTVPIWVNLGPAHINARSSGTHRWQVTIAAKTLGTAGTYCRVLAVQKKPTELGRILVKSPEVDVRTIAARDDYSQTAGSLSGKTALVGGSYTRSGDTTDFSVSGSGSLSRVATSDSSGIGCYETLAVNHTGVSASVTVGQSSGLGISNYIGIVLRYVDSSNYAIAYITPIYTLGAGWGAYTVGILKCIGGSRTVLGTNSSLIGGTSFTINASILADGRYGVEVERGGGGTVSVSGSDSVFATGGTLASGVALGLYDEHTSATAATRTYDEFTAFALAPPEAAIHPSQDAAWQPNGAFEREASAGTYWAYAAGQQGAGVPRLGPAGDEGLINRLTIATADQNPDFAATGNQAAPFSWVLKHRPAYLFGRHEA